MPDAFRTLYCPWDGRPLGVLRVVARHRSELHKCSRCRASFVTLYDERSVYPPLLPLHDRRAEKALAEAPDSDLEAAFLALRRVDSRTVSTEDFEWALVGVYARLRPDRFSYRAEPVGGAVRRVVGAWGDRRFVLEVDRTDPHGPAVAFPTEPAWDRDAPEWARGLWHDATRAADDWAAGQGLEGVQVTGDATVAFR